jgi:hypothetical protein
MSITSLQTGFSQQSTQVLGNKNRHIYAKLYVELIDTQEHSPLMPIS